MRVLVVGANGFLGRHLCKELIAAGIDVVRASSADGSGIDPATGLLPPSFAVPASTDTVIYLAQSPLNSSLPISAAHLLAVNVHSAVRTAILARGSGVTRFIHASTGNVYQPAFTPLREGDQTRRDGWYALSKLHAEEALALFQGDMDVTSVRIFGLYGPAQSGRLVPNLIRSVAEGKPVTLERKPGAAESDGGLRISMLNVRDAVRILRSLIAKRGLGVLNLAGEQALSIRQMAETIGEELRTEPIFNNAANTRAGDLVADISLLRSIFNLSFVAFRAGIRELAATTARET